MLTWSSPCVNPPVEGGCHRRIKRLPANAAVKIRVCWLSDKLLTLCRATAAQMTRCMSHRIRENPRSGRTKHRCEDLSKTARSWKAPLTNLTKRPKSISFFNPNNAFDAEGLTNLRRRKPNAAVVNVRSGTGCSAVREKNRDALTLSENRANVRSLYDLWSRSNKLKPAPPNKTLKLPLLEAVSAIVKQNRRAFLLSGRSRRRRRTKASSTVRELRPSVKYVLKRSNSKHIVTPTRLYLSPPPPTEQQSQSRSARVNDARRRCGSRPANVFNATAEADRAKQVAPDRRGVMMRKPKRSN